MKCNFKVCVWVREREREREMALLSRFLAYGTYKLNHSFLCMLLKKNKTLECRVVKLTIQLLESYMFTSLNTSSIESHCFSVSLFKLMQAWLESYKLAIECEHFAISARTKFKQKQHVFSLFWRISKTENLRHNSSVLFAVLLFKLEAIDFYQRSTKQNTNRNICSPKFKQMFFQ